MSRICGLAAVEALFEHDPRRVERLLFEPRLRPVLARYCAVLARARKPYREADSEELARVAGSVLHGGIVAIARPQPVLPLDLDALPAFAASRKPLLVLDGIGNPHNLGAIARTAAFFGIERLLLAEGPRQALPSDAAYRVAEGGLECLILYRAPLGKALPRLKPFYRILGTAPPVSAGRETNRFEPSQDRPWALVLGNEEAGIAPAHLAQCDQILRIPGAGAVQSLNVAAVAAILLYLLSRG